jgi:hypothetical protein
MPMPVPATTPSLLALPNEILILILTHLFRSTHLTIIASDSSTPTRAQITNDPPLKPLLLTCRTLNREARWVARRGVTSVLWDLEGAGGSGVWGMSRDRRRERELRSQRKGWWDWVGEDVGTWWLGKQLLPKEVMAGVKEVEVCVPATERLCGRCTLRWLEGLVGSCGGLEQVLLRVGVKKVSVGDFLRLLGGRQERDVMREMMGCWAAVGDLVGGRDSSTTRPVRMLVEVAYICEVRMACGGRHSECGDRCFAEDFLVSILAIRHTAEEGWGRCADEK